MPYPLDSHRVTSDNLAARHPFRELPVGATVWRTNAESGMDTKKIVLVVDDNLDHRTIAVALLTYAGYTALQAEDTELATRMIRAYQPSLVVIDVDMPEKNGLDWALELRANPGTAALPIMAYTGYRDVYTREFRKMGIAAVDKADGPHRFLDSVMMILGDQTRPDCRGES